MTLPQDHLTIAPLLTAMGEKNCAGNQMAGQCGNVWKAIRGPLSEFYFRFTSRFPGRVTAR